MDVRGLVWFSGVLKTLSFESNEQSQNSPLSLQASVAQALFPVCAFMFYVKMEIIFIVYFHLYIYFCVMAFNVTPFLCLFCLGFTGIF